MGMFRAFVTFQCSITLHNYVWLKRKTVRNIYLCFMSRDSVSIYDGALMMICVKIIALASVVNVRPSIYYESLFRLQSTFHAVDEAKL